MRAEGVFPGMAFALGSGSSNRRPRADMNVRPLIDVLLVLLIIFLIIQPDKQYGLPVNVPEQDKNSQTPSEPDPTTVVLEVKADESLAINQQPVKTEELAPRLREIYSRRAAKILFVKGDPTLEFSQVAKPIDIARGAGITQVALLR